MKIHKTSKLYYGKYPYRVETRIRGGNMIKHKQDINEILKSIPPWQSNNFKTTDIANLVNYFHASKEFFDEGFKRRAEGSFVTYYTDSHSEYTRICNKLNQWIYCCHEPDSDFDLDMLRSKRNIIMCDKLPHGKYQYKMFLKSRMSENQKLTFLKWSENYGDNIEIPKSTYKYLAWSNRYSNRYSENYSIYIKDQKLLMMAHLFLGENIRKTYEYVLRDTQINSVSEDTLCPT